MLVRIGVAGVLGGGASTGEFFITLLGHGEYVFDLVSLAGHFIEHELELRSQAQASLWPTRERSGLGLIECLLGALAFAFLVAFVAELGPVDLGDLQSLVTRTSVTVMLASRLSCSSRSMEEATTR